MIFPGAENVFLDQPLNQPESLGAKSKVPPPMVNDLSAVKSELIEISAQASPFNTNDIRQTMSKTLANQKEQLTSQLKALELNNSDIMESSQSEEYKSVRQNKVQQKILTKKPKEVLGLVSAMKELFLFEKKVPYSNTKVECWLQGTESAMQETVGKLINYSVNTFPKQSLDEWILDYPQ